MNCEIFLLSYDDYLTKNTKTLSKYPNNKHGKVPTYKDLLDITYKCGITLERKETHNKELVMQ